MTNETVPQSTDPRDDQSHLLPHATVTRCPSAHPRHGQCWDIAGHYVEGEPETRHYVGAGDEYDEYDIYWTDVEAATEEPDRTLTAPERRAESEYIAPVGVAEVPVTEARIAQVLDHIAAGQPAVWRGAGADDPNDEITGGEA